jgi:predicted transcriptional regulator
MGRVPTTVQLTDDLVAALDRVAATRGTSRSALIRRAIEESLAADVEAEISRQIIEGYKRIPPGTPDEWGDLDTQLEHNAREMMRRLDEEEREAGFGPWKKPKGRRRSRT